MKRKIKNTFFFSLTFLFSGVSSSTQTLFQSEMLKDEKILWSGQPEPGFFMTKGDIFLILFALFFLGPTGYMEFFAILSFDLISMVFFSPFVILGSYILVWNPVYKHYQKKKTHYAVTNQRVLILIDSSDKKVESKLISQIPVLNKTINKDGIGTIQFDNPGYVGTGEYSSRIEVPSFDNIKNVDTVYKMISDLKLPHEVY